MKYAKSLSPHGYIIQGQGSSKRVDHHKPNSLDYWLRHFAMRANALAKYMRLFNSEANAQGGSSRNETKARRESNVRRSKRLNIFNFERFGDDFCLITIFPASTAAVPANDEPTYDQPQHSTNKTQHF